MKGMQKIWRILLYPISRQPRFYLGLIALFSISILFIEYGRCSRSRAGLEMFGDTYILCAFICLLPQRCQHWTRYLVFALFYVIGLVDMVCYQLMGVALTPNVLQVWLQTNMQEATEACGLFLSPALLLTPVALLLLLPIVVFVLRDYMPRLPRWLLASLLLLTLVSGIYGLPNKRYLHYVLSRVSDDDMVGFQEIESMTHEYLPVYRLAFSLKEVHRFSDVRERLLEHATSAQVDSCSAESPLIVLIIGESYNRHHASLYGYPLPTTPCQERLYQQGNLFKFTDVIASYNLTFKSFQNMLTLYDYDAGGRWYDYPLLPVLFRTAGYKVSFYSNQYALDKTSSFANYSEDVLMSNPDISDYMFDDRNRSIHPYDLDLVSDYVQTADTLTAQPQLVIFHFIGLHFNFHQRYPADQKMFTEEDYDRPDLSREEKRILADYDNSIVYNDHVLDAIVRQFSSRDAIVIFVPDHGELVYDNCREMGRNLKHEPMYLIPQFDIPFWIYCSPAYMDHHPDICQHIMEATDRPFMTDDLPHVLLSLGGIATPMLDQRRNLISSQFNAHRRRLIKGEVDYDAICK